MLRAPADEWRLSKARDEAVREVAVGGWPAVALREADSQKRRVTFDPSVRGGDANTRRVAETMTCDPCRSGAQYCNDPHKRVACMVDGR